MCRDAKLRWPIAVKRSRGIVSDACRNAIRRRATRQAMFRPSASPPGRTLALPFQTPVARSFLPPRITQNQVSHSEKFDNSLQLNNFAEPDPQKSPQGHRKQARGKASSERRAPQAPLRELELARPASTPEISQRQRPTAIESRNETADKVKDSPSPPVAGGTERGC